MSVVAQFRGLESVDGYSPAVYLTKPVILVSFREKAFQGAAEPFCLTFAPWVITEAFREIEVQVISPFHYGLGLEFPLDRSPFLNQS